MVALLPLTLPLTPLVELTQQSLRHRFSKGIRVVDVGKILREPVLVHLPRDTGINSRKFRLRRAKGVQ